MGSAFDIFTLSEVVFVFTDIQDSTPMSAADPVAMKCVPKCSLSVPQMFPQRSLKVLGHNWSDTPPPRIKRTLF
jgi:hypothetical protein